MNPFELYNQSQRQVSDAERRLAHKQARHAELLPDMLEQERLSIELKAAESRLQTAREVDALARRIQERMRLRGEGGNATNVSQVHNQDAREREYTAAAAALAALHKRIEAKDRELRQRYGLPPES